MTKTKPWIKRHMTQGKRMTRVDFKKFLEKTGVTVEALERVLGYSKTGVVLMLDRGSAKNDVIRTLEKNFPQVRRHVNMLDYQRNEEN